MDEREYEEALDTIDLLMGAEDGTSEMDELKRLVAKVEAYEDVNFPIREPETAYIIAPLDSREWKCNWLECAGSMGLAGCGICTFRGDWADENCEKFITDEDYEREWRLEYIANTPWYTRLINSVKVVGLRIKLFMM